ncbi:ribonuclease H-like protein [Pochonia chlamydosporia 170]|uniref:Ribonuclease H-like protein n=1 Tax=Pochonia chlamydosporia 170 TaxID=1380566 RepID=A0A179F8T3_METCM|nr:ribonuclease H-like protein [Pochonia chlamydosporia 170]OAQ61509.1 ribonuclease H-like protein [Pochonia chlamydosporia 170]
MGCQYNSTLAYSVLRTQDLHDQCHSPPSDAEDLKPDIIQSRHWLVQNNQYYSKNDNLFCFGKPRSVLLCKLEGRLKGLLANSSPLILVVHGGHRQTTLLQKLNINLAPVFTLDTTSCPLSTPDFLHLSLKRLLQAFSIPFTGDRLHVAGNDAHFTLRVLLMIAVTDVQRELDEAPAWVPVFEAIA